MTDYQDEFDEKARQPDSVDKMVSDDDVDERYTNKDDPAFEASFSPTAYDMLAKELSDDSNRVLTASAQSSIADKFYQTHREMAVVIFSFASTWDALQYALYDHDLDCLKAPSIIAHLEGMNASLKEEDDGASSETSLGGNRDDYEPDVEQEDDADCTSFIALRDDSPIYDKESCTLPYPLEKPNKGNAKNGPTVRRINSRIRLVGRTVTKLGGYQRVEWIKSEKDYSELLAETKKYRYSGKPEREMFARRLSHEFNLSFVYFVKAQVARLLKDYKWYRKATVEQRMQYLSQEGIASPILYDGIISRLNVMQNSAIASRNILVRTNLKAPMKMANDITSRKSRHDPMRLDLFSEASIGLLIAADRYHPAAQVKFVTFATNWMRQRILRYLIQHQNTIRLPCHVHSNVQTVVNAISTMLRMNDRWNERELPSKEEVEKFIDASKSKAIESQPSSLDGESTDANLDEGSLIPKKQPSRTSIQPLVWKFALNKVQGVSMCVSFDMNESSNGSPENTPKSGHVFAEHVKSNFDEVESIKKALLETITHICPDTQKKLFDDKEVRYIDLKFAQRLIIEDIQKIMFEEYNVDKKEFGEIASKVKNRLVRHLRREYPDVVEGLGRALNDNKMKKAKKGNHDE